MHKIQTKIDINIKPDVFDKMFMYAHYAVKHFDSEVAGAMGTAVRNVLSFGNEYPTHIFYDYKMGQSWVMQENFAIPDSANSLPPKEVSNV